MVVTTARTKASEQLRSERARWEAAAAAAAAAAVMAMIGNAVDIFKIMREAAAMQVLEAAFEAEMAGIERKATAFNEGIDRHSIVE